MAIGGRASPGPARGFEAPTLTSMSMSMSIEPTGDAYIPEGDLTIRVVAEVTGHPTTKTVIQYFRRRKNYRRLKGHRQPFIEVRIKSILNAGEN